MIAFHFDYVMNLRPHTNRMYSKNKAGFTSLFISANNCKAELVIRKGQGLT